MTGIAPRRESHFSRAQKDALFAAILVHDEIHPDPELPAVLHPDYDADQIAACFALSRQLWAETAAGPAMARMVGRIARRGALAPADVTPFKHIRARYKQLRFVYALFDSRHRYPPAFDLATRAMSSLQDALVIGRKPAVIGRAIAARLLLGRVYRAVVARELAAVRPTTPQGFRDYVRRDIASCRALAESGRMTGRQFHATRKIISRQVALYDCLRVLYPSAYHDRMSVYLSTINGLMGGLHDDMIREKYAGTRDYEREITPVPERITRMLLALIALHAAPPAPPPGSA